MQKISSPNWCAIDDVQLPEKLAPLLTERGSFSQKITQACGHPCQVQVQSEMQQTPWQDEKAVLKLAEDTAWVREVALVYDHTYAVARSVLPNALFANDSRFAELGNVAMAKILFDDENIHRQDIEVAQVSEGHGLYEYAKGFIEDTPETLWARRSLFQIHGQVLLVCEVLLPALQNIVSIKQ